MYYMHWMDLENVRGVRVEKEPPTPRDSQRGAGELHTLES